MEDIAHHILDIVENSLEAGASMIRIKVSDREEPGRLVVEIVDNGKGMDHHLLSRATDPFVTTRTTRSIGVGLSFLKQAAEQTGGRLIISSQPGVGTSVKAEFITSHIDFPPLGDIHSVLKALFITHPEVQWIVDYDVEGESAHLETNTSSEGSPVLEPSISEPNSGFHQLIKDRLHPK